MLKALVISDIHDNLNNLLKVVKSFNLVDFSHIIFCGDMVSPFTASIINKHISNNHVFLGVWGNNEGDRDTIKAKINKGELGGNVIIYEWNRRNVLIIHGTGSIDITEKLIISLLKSLDYDIIFFGHTHLAKIFLCDKNTREIKAIDVKAILSSNTEKAYEFDLDELVIAINPGELCGYLTGIPSIALVDLNGSKIKIRFIRIDSI